MWIIETKSTADRWCWARDGVCEGHPSFMSKQFPSHKGETPQTGNANLAFPTSHSSESHCKSTIARQPIGKNAIARRLAVKLLATVFFTMGFLVVGL
ncbi:hypothetical protein J6590_038216 [Homalodisca vitripennis]|nr:hypothetical protein J6590_038216 [Homalodisca vitripennis]